MTNSNDATYRPELILLVDDEENSRRLLRRLLETEGYLIEEAGDGAEALEKLGLNRPTVVLVDGLMPGMDGFEFCAQLRQLPREAQIPVIMITSLDDQQSVDRAFDAGAVDYITKPIHWPVVRQRLRRVLLTERTQKELKAKHNLLRTLIDNMPDVVYFKDNASRFVDANTAMVASFGLLGVHELIGKTDFDYLPQERAAQFYADERTVQSGQPLLNHEELVVDAQTGQEKWLLTTKVPVRDNQGNITGLVGVGRDITKRKLAEERLRESQATLNIAQRIARIGSWELDLSNVNDGRNHLVHCSDELFIIFGYQPGEIEFTRESFLSAVHPDDRDKLRAVMAEALITGSEYSIEHRIILPDGAERIVHEQSTMIYAESSGKPLKMVGVCQDITERRRAEETLENERSLLRTLIDNLPDYIFTKDREGKFVISNLAHTRAAAVPSSEALVGKTALDIFPTEFGAQFHADDLALMQTGNALINLERTTVDQDGNPRTVLTTKVPLRDDVGEVIGLVGISRDISARKHIEAAEQEQRALAEALRDTAEALIGALDPDDVMIRILENVGRVVPHDWSTILLLEGDSARVAYTRGWTAEEDALLRSARLPLDTPILRRMLIENKPIIVADTSAEPKWVQIVARVRSLASAPIRVRGQVIGFLDLTAAEPGFFTDQHAERLQVFANQAAIAIENAQLYDQMQRYASDLERRIADRTRELQRAKEDVEAIFNSASDAILVVQIDGRIQRANSGFNVQFGYQPDEVLAQSLLMLVNPNYAERLMSALALTVKIGSSQRIEVEAYRKAGTGTPFDADVELSLIMHQEEAAAAVGPPEVVCSIRNITERKQLERELQALNKLKTEFLSTAAHELRTPLASVVGFSELLVTREMDAARTKHYIQIIHKQGKQLATIIDALLDISRLEARQGMALEPSSLDLSQLLTKALSYFAEYLPRYQFQVDGITGRPPVTADPFRLEQVLQNVLSNAIKYSPNGGVITVRGQTVPGFVQISIQDQGIGMTAEQQRHLFERFYRADSSNTTISGTGLGLSICKLIIELHGGQIWAESELGVGSTIYFTLPTPDDEVVQSMAFESGDEPE